MNWSSVTPFFGFHHVLMILCILAMVFWSVLVAGCTSSNGLSNVYLISLSYKGAGVTATNSSLQVNHDAGNCFIDGITGSSKTIRQINIGFMALCVQLNSGIWLCGSSAQDIAQNLKDQESVDADPFNLVWIAEKFRTNIIFYGFLIAVVVMIFFQFLLLATFPGWHEDDVSSGSVDRMVKPFPSRKVTVPCLALAYIALLLSFVTVLWQHIGGAAASKLLELLSYGIIQAEVGATAMVLGWVGVAFTAIVALGIHTIKVSTNSITSTKLSSVIK
ncbi:hypothetical protein J7T55_014286 [Diaporthe amygdali]|uniref:uncharacterized protein n=1 Tax=Phomopsis amygdali TaxID=1214568 RepID=UPI0022FE6641|nr:uncharacterized protein J7T55_014286 [Diaporthe amygdali]KAJ0117837.1 hypothetical protein J7T55_014286 [Diaporthe amygdali]